MNQRPFLYGLAPVCFAALASGMLSEAALSWARGASQPALLLQRVYALGPDEGVFAYARISPDGKELVYASEASPNRNVGRRRRQIRIVNLERAQVTFTEVGFDAYWSPDGKRMIFLGEDGAVAIRDVSGQITRGVAPVELGDYYSWGVRGGKDIILTVQNRYYTLRGNIAVLPADSVTSCRDIGTGERPLISKDGTKITTFSRGTVVVRNLSDCDGVFDTGLRGAKADFSWDGRMIAFHAPKLSGSGYDIVVVDLVRRTSRTITQSLGGSSLFPSWTRDGRLCFRYDGDGFRGFVLASNVLTVPEEPLPRVPEKLPRDRTWEDLFASDLPEPTLSLVMLWGTWSAHVPSALRELKSASRSLSAEGRDVAVRMATDIGSDERDVVKAMIESETSELRIPMVRSGFIRTEAVNQNPAMLMFRKGRVIDYRLGAQSAAALTEWVRKSEQIRQ